MPRRKIRRGRPRLKYYEKMKFFRKQHEKYKKMYDRTQKWLEKRGLEMYDPNKYEDLGIFIAKYKENRQEIAKTRAYAKEKGKEFTEESTLRHMLSSQTFKYSSQQYKGIIESVRENREIFEQYNIDIERFRLRNGKASISETEFKASQEIFTEEDYKGILRAYYDFKEKGKKLGKIGKELVDWAREQVSANFFDSP